MTMAVCYSCGEAKFGAFVACKKCNTKPKNNDDIALSLFLSDHFFEKDNLRQMGESIKNGGRFALPEEVKELVFEALDELKSELNTSVQD
jgi:hypothetical protein